MFIMQTPKEKLWHVVAVLDCKTVGHTHPSPALCYVETGRVQRMTDRMDSIGAHHEGVVLCGYCLEALLIEAGNLTVPCEKLPEFSKKQKD